jgi:uncharacterized coiled-coil DUF342 family protein
MGDAGERVKELDYLGGKVYQAKELIGRLREANRDLASRLEEVQHRLESQTIAERPLRDEAPENPDPDTEALVAEIARLRDERRQIRERVSSLLERIEALERS